jgi:Glycosyl hydrolase family 1
VLRGAAANGSLLLGRGLFFGRSGGEGNERLAATSADHPAALHQRGGWANRDMGDCFGDYSAILYKRLGDRIEYWTSERVRRTA